MATQVKLKQLVKGLEDFKIPLSGDSNSLDKLRRHALYLPMFVLMEFPHISSDDYHQAWSFNNYIQGESNKQGRPSHLFIKEGLQNCLPSKQPKKGYSFNQFIMANLDTLIKYVDYLLVGNDELEATFPNRAVDGATTIARVTIAEQLEKSLRISYQKH